MGSAAASMLYSLLPVAVRDAVDLPTFAAVGGVTGLALHRAIGRLWESFFGVFGKEGGAALRTEWRLRRIRYFARIGALKPEEVREAMRRIAEEEVFGPRV